MYLINLINLIFVGQRVHADTAENWQLGFQDPATPVMEGIVNFHDDIFFFIILVVVGVCYFIARCIVLFTDKSEKSSNFAHGTLLEIIWTVTPAALLVIIAIPSFALLYSMDEIIDPEFTLKVVGHQWYWSYEYTDHSDIDQNLNFDSYMIPTSDLEKGNLRLLEVDNRVVLPIKTHIRVIITSADVLHSWAVPSLGVKLDACPGRLNQTSIFLKRPGIFYGQCSEICGINHGFMPIAVEAVTLPKYLTWLFNQNEN